MRASIILAILVSLGASPTLARAPCATEWSVVLAVPEAPDEATAMVECKAVDDMVFDECRVVAGSLEMLNDRLLAFARAEHPRDSLDKPPAPGDRVLFRARGGTLERRDYNALPPGQACSAVAA